MTESNEHLRLRDNDAQYRRAICKEIQYYWTVLIEISSRSRVNARELRNKIATRPRQPYTGANSGRRRHVKRKKEKVHINRRTTRGRQCAAEKGRMTDTSRPREDRIDHGFEASTNIVKYSNYIP